MAPLDRFRRKKAESAAPKPPTGEALGRSGTVNTQGFLEDRETNHALRFPQNLEVYEEMRRTDATVRWILALIKMPILAGQVMIEAPEDPDPTEREAAAFADHWKDEHLHGGWQNFIRHALLCEDYGHMVFEKCAELRSVSFQYEDDEDKPHEVERDVFVVSKLAPRLPRTLQKWNVDSKDPSKLVSVEQWLLDGNGTTSNPVIPADRLVIFTREQEGDDFRGVSLLRAAYKPWRYKLELENLEAIAIERSTGLPVAYAPNATPAEMDALEESFINLRSQENPYIIVPKSKQSAQAPDGWIIDFPTLNAEGGVSASDAIGRHEAALARNVLAEFMRLGHENTGARAVGDVQQDPYWKGIEAEVAFLEDVINEQVIRPMLDWNYDLKRFPRLKFAKIQAKNVQVIADAVQKLQAAGVLIPDAQMEDWARGLLDAPEAQREGEDPHATMLEQKLNPPEPPGFEGGQPVNPPHQPPPKPGDPSRPSGPAKLADATTGLTLHRPLRAEEEVLALSDIVAALDSGEQQIENAARAWAEHHLPTKQADAAVEHRSPEGAEGLSVDNRALADDVYSILLDVYRNGRHQVAGELERQGAPAEFADKTPPPEADRLKRLRALADNVAASVSAAAMRALRSLTLRRIEHPDQTPTGPGFDPVVAAGAEAKRAARPTISQTFADGRSDAILLNQDLIEKTIYSAILDNRTCGACAYADGEENPPGEGKPCPNPDCEGGGACRCMRVPVISSARSGLPRDIGPGYVVA